MPIEETSMLSNADQEYLDRNWNDAQNWHGLTDEEKERGFRREARKKRSISDGEIDKYVNNKKKSKDEEAA